MYVQNIPSKFNLNYTTEVDAADKCNFQQGNSFKGN